MKPAGILVLDSRTTGAPPFNAGDLSRTHMRAGGRWLALARTTHEVMDPEHEPWIMAGVGEQGPRSGASMRGAWYVCHERADVPLVATTDPEGDRVVAMTWQNGRMVMSNGRIPCLHADPAIADCPPQETVHAQGRVFTLSGGLSRLWDACTGGGR